MLELLEHFPIVPIIILAISDNLPEFDTHRNITIETLKWTALRLSSEVNCISIHFIGIFRADLDFIFNVSYFFLFIL